MPILVHLLPLYTHCRGMMTSDPPVPVRVSEIWNVSLYSVSVVSWRVKGTRTQDWNLSLSPPLSLSGTFIFTPNKKESEATFSFFFCSFCSLTSFFLFFFSFIWLHQCQRKTMCVNVFFFFWYSADVWFTVENKSLEILCQSYFIFPVRLFKLRIFTDSPSFLSLVWSCILCFLGWLSGSTLSSHIECPFIVTPTCVSV